ncbi:hypothetical protein Q5752_006685 [Cryptotrichosporon argae]
MLASGSGATTPGSSFGPAVIRGVQMPVQPPIPRRRKQRFSRSRTGCLTCRQRRVRCDEAHPVCEKCASLDRVCVWADGIVAASPAPGSLWMTEASLCDETGSGSDGGTDEALAGVDGSASPRSTSRPPAKKPRAMTGSSSRGQTAIALTRRSSASTRARAASLLPLVQAVSAPTSLTMGTSAIALRRARAQPQLPTFSFALPSVTPSTTMEPFMQAFPSPSARRLFHHYLTSTSTIVIAMGQRDDWSQNPFLAVSLPLISLNTESPARAALRLSLLSAAAAHIHHLRLSGPGAGAVAAAELAHDDMLAETRRAKRQATGKMLLSLSKEGDAELDAVLAACVIIMTRDVLSADAGWRDNLDFAIGLIHKRGGPAAMLARDPANYTRRFILEQLTTHDVFGSFTTGQEPNLLGAWAPWWFECEQASTTSAQWESCERQFGVSRGMIDVVARCRIVCWKKTRLGPDYAGDAELEAVADLLDQEAWGLIDELRIWAISQQDSPRKARIQFGDHIYRHAMTIYLLGDVLRVAAAEPSIQAAVHCVLELCSEISTEPVMLVWPLMIAGAAAAGADRDWARQLFDAFGSQYCYDLPMARRVLEEQWKRIDAGRGPEAWDVLMKEMGCNVLLI